MLRIATVPTSNRCLIVAWCAHRWSSRFDVTSAICHRIRVVLQFPPGLNECLNPSDLWLWREPMASAVWIFNPSNFPVWPVRLRSNSPAAAWLISKCACGTPDGRHSYVIWRQGKSSTHAYVTKHGMCCTLTPQTWIFYQRIDSN